jgi:hypothetical protein
MLRFVLVACGCVAFGATGGCSGWGTAQHHPFFPRGSSPVRVLRCVHRLPGSGGTAAEPAPDEKVVAVRKQAWEAQFGGQEAARPAVRARMSAWPVRLISETVPPSSDGDFLRMIAADTWRGLAAFTDRENGLPVDNVRLEPGPQTRAPEGVVGDYTSGTNIGLYLASVVAARNLNLVSAEEAHARVANVLRTVEGLEKYRGFIFNFYDTTSLERTSHFVSFIDAAWMLAGLVAVRAAMPELASEATRLIDGQNFAVFYDREKDLIRHGYWVQRQKPSIYHYGVFYSEARLGALLAIGKGDIPSSVWHAMLRVPPPLCSRPGPLVRGFLLNNPNDGRAPIGYYEWEGYRYVPSWGGSMFEALMPTLLVDEMALSPNGLGRNDLEHARVQRHYALGELKYPVWGMSPSARVDPSGYSEFGVPMLGARGYPEGVVTPHAAALALAVMPREAVTNLRELITHFPVYGDYGFYDAVDPMTGRVARAYLALDQAMLFLSVADYLDGGRLRETFEADPIVQAALPLLESEEVPFD